MSGNQADWRPNPVAERDIREGRRQERRRRQNIALLVLATVGVCPLSCFGTCLSGVSGANPAFLLIPVAAFGALIVSIMRYNDDKTKARARSSALHAEYGGVDGWIVELSIYQGEAVSGRDFGTIWFEDDRLLFTGARTSFGLGIGDVEKRVADANKLIDTNLQFIIPLRERTRIGSVSLGLRFVALYSDLSSEVSEARFDNEFRRWIAGKGGFLGQLPPLSFGPDLPSMRSLKRRAVLATMGWPVLIVLAIFLDLARGATDALMFCQAGLFLVAWKPARSPRRCWRAVHDRRRLEAYNREQ